MDCIIHRSDLLDGSSIQIPSSKSLSHRALICASLAQGKSEILGLGDNQDISATKRVMVSLGASFENKDGVTIVHGTGGDIHYDGSVIDCGESGSTLRFLIPVAALTSSLVTFTGHGKLMERPQTIYEKLFHEKQLDFKKEDHLLHVKGPLTGGEYYLDGNVSSQFISGLLFALPLCKADSVLHILPPFESKSYVDLTLDYLRQAQIEIQHSGNDYLICGNQSYQPFHGTVEGDDSQMAFFLALACLQQKTLFIHNIRHDSRQGDHVMLSFVKEMGAIVEEVEDGYRITGKPLRGITADLSNCPDLGPILFALATQCEGISRFENCGRLRIKESDRIACMEEELTKLGCQIHSEGDTVIVEGKSPLRENTVLDGHNDHRIVMALSVLSSITDLTTITGAQAINKSYPGFFEDIGKLGIKVTK